MEAARPPGSHSERAETGADAATSGVSSARDADRRAVEAGLREARLKPGAWAALTSFDPDWLRGRLADHGGDAAWRERFAATLPIGQWRDVLALWISPEDAGFLQDLLADGAPWRLEGGERPERLLGVLRQALLGTLLAEPHKGLDLPQAVSTLVAARARLDDRLPTEIAEAMSRAWPTAGPAAALRPRLAPILATLGAGRTEVEEDALAPWRERLEAGLARGV
jgi:hypothetical protein